MAVPKKKTSKSRRNMRRSHHAIAKINVIVDSETGEYKLPHHMNVKDGIYNGKQILTIKEVDDSEE